MKRVWETATPIREGSTAFGYLLARVGRIRPSTALREDGGMMIARVSDAKDRGVNLHRTLVPRGGWQRGVSVKRLVMRGTLPGGCAVRLWPAGEVLGIAEGIETAISASRLFNDIPVWAALNAQNLVKWTPPEGVKHVVIFGDNDRSYTGQEASYVLARRLAKIEGLEVRVEIPAAFGSDWNDVWNME
jgi:putative DNA primase/helicase